MFTGIIESKGRVSEIVREGDNIHFTVESDISQELKIDQSVSHNGVCLTVVKQEDKSHTVTAILETLLKSNLGDWKVDDSVNLERAMKPDARLDGHFVQGHVDRTATCTDVREADGSWYFSFEFDPSEQNVLIEKGSICINGVSLTLVDVKDNKFSVAIIPYTYEHTNFKQFKKGTIVNLEFDVIGKYISTLFLKYLPQLQG